MTSILICIAIFLLGICLGSFFACIGYRIPNKISTVYPGSFCPKCKTTLKWYMNIPLFSYIFLNGKCAYCQEKISPIYFITELITGVSYLLSYIYFGFTMDFLIMITIISVLSVTIVTDFKYYYISDRVIIISLIILFIIHTYFNGIKVSLHYLISGIIISLLMYLIKLLGDKIFKKESLGGGDIKLVSVLGMMLGLINAITRLIFASCLALIASLIIMKKNKEGIVPFGPFLIIGGIIMYLLAFNGIVIV